LAEKKRQLLDLEAQLASLKELRPIVERASVDMETIGGSLDDLVRRLEGGE
jgi:hypothetical protein